MKTKDRPVQSRKRRFRLLPWFIGVAVIVVIDTFLLLFVVSEGASELAENAALIGIPAIYLTLMYLTLTSQK
jgi:hypothetical protein